MVLRSENGTPVTIRDVGNVRIGPAQTRGIAELDGEGQTVGAVVIMRQGENALDVIDGVKARLAELKPTLPAGVELVPTYDRSRLIRDSIGTLRRTLIEEMVVVALVILVFLLHVRSTLVPVLMLPIAVLLAFVPMAAMRLGANIMSLGGIAIAIGAMVDAAIIVVENVHKRLERWEAEGRTVPRNEVVVEGLTEVGRPIFFSLLVITVAFLPVFTLEGTEGRLFRPLAYTKTFSMAFAALLSVTLVPAVAALFIRGRIRPEDENPVARLLAAVYGPVCRFSLRFRWPVVIGALLLVAATVPVARRLSSEFMPPLNEGTLLYMPTAVPGMSEASAGDVLQRMDRLLKSFPEVERVFGKAGRFSTPTDPAPLEMFETVVELRPPGSLAGRRDLGGAGQQARRRDAVHRHAERLVDADPDPDGDAGDRRPQPARHPGPGARPRRHRPRGPPDRNGAAATCPEPAAPSPSGSAAATTSTSTSIATRPRATASTSRTSRRPSRRRSAARR